MTKRSLSLLLTLAMLCTAALAADTSDWAAGDGVADTSWYSAVESSFTLTTAEQLAGLAVLVNEGDSFSGKTVTLGNDIDLSAIANWTPIGKAKNEPLTITSQEELSEAAVYYKVIYDDVGNSYTGSARDVAYVEGRSFYYAVPGVFSGTFDGGGHTISGLYVETDISYAGLFGNVDGTVRNFTLSSGKVRFSGDNGDYIGSVAGMLSMGGTISRVISNVTVSAGNAYNVGGIAGFVGARLSGESANNTVVEMCVNNGTVTGYNKAGGIVGQNAGIVSLCVNNGNVTVLRANTKNGVGGIVGRNGNIYSALEAATIINCYNTGTVGSTKWSGGIAGFNNAYSKVENCYTTTCPARALSYSNPIVGNNESVLGGNNYALIYDGLSYTGTAEREVGILLESDELQKAAYALGGAYRSSPTGGYPELAWMLDCSTIVFDVAPTAAGYTVQMVDSLGVQVAPESDGSFLLVNGETYTYTVSASGYRPVSGSLTVETDETVSVILNEVIGPVVTVNNATGTATPAAVTGVVSGLDYVSGSKTFHVDCDRACVVAYSTDGGATYTRLTAEANAGGGYDFTVDLTADTEIAVVLKGDLNLNGTVNSADALQIQRYAVGVISLTPLKELAADVNRDGKVNTADALQLQRCIVGITAFGW